MMDNDLIADNTNTAQVFTGVLAKEETGISLADNLFIVPVPDNINFGEGLDGKPITFGEVKTKDINTRILLLRKRLQIRFIDQMSILHENSKAFPLAIMTCVGYETIGKIAFKRESKHLEFWDAIKD